MTITSSDIFGGISAIAQLSAALTVGVSALFGYRQLSLWRTQSIAEKRGQAAEDLLLAVLEVDNALRLIRNPGVHLREDATDKERETWIVYLDRIADSHAVFEALRKASLRAAALLPTEETENHVEKLMELRRKTYAAAHSLASKRQGWEAQPDLKDFYEKLRWNLWGTYDDKDELGKEQIAAVAALRETLSPIIRFEEKKK